MITEHFTYYQPEHYMDDGTNIEYGGTPEGLASFQVFRTREDCEEWLRKNGYEPGDFVIKEYQDDDIEDITLLDSDGENIDRIEDLANDEIADRIVESVIWNAGSVENLRTLKQDDESDQEYQDRIYTEAMDEIMDAVEEIEAEKDYNFQSYAGTPDIDWYDEAREIALIEIMGYMTGEEE
jgi:hypothetical protein